MRKRRKQSWSDICERLWQRATASRNEDGTPNELAPENWWAFLRQLGHEMPEWAEILAQHKKETSRLAFEYAQMRDYSVCFGDQICDCTRCADVKSRVVPIDSWRTVDASRAYG